MFKYTFTTSSRKKGGFNEFEIYLPEVEGWLFTRLLDGKCADGVRIIDLFDEVWNTCGLLLEITFGDILVETAATDEDTVDETTVEYEVDVEANEMELQFTA